MNYVVGCASYVVEKTVEPVSAHGNMSVSYCPLELLVAVSFI